ncbi:MAG: hypothetical protein ACUVRO_02670 [Armatimonadota bacterium]
MRRLTQRQDRGTSLVEVLVVMVVLVLGILTAIRMYPLGFSNLRHTENVSVAHRLAQAEVERLKSDQKGLPELIAAVDPSGKPAGSVLDPTVRPDDMSVHPHAAPAEAALWSDVNKIRKVLGEEARIPAPVETGFGRASLYTLAFGPIDWPPTGVLSEQQADAYIQVYGTPMVGVDVQTLTPEEQKDLLTRLGPSRYAIDYARGAIAVASAPYPRKLKADYSYYVRGGVVRTVTGDILEVPAETRAPYVEVPLGVVNRRSQIFDPAFLPGPAGGVQPGSETISPKLRYVPFGQAFSTNNELEFKVVGTFGAAGQFGATIAFHPRAHIRLRTAAAGVSRPAVARIDYQVADWHIIREDKGIPSSPPYDVKLALPFIKEAGVTQEETQLTGGPPALSVYKGIVPSLPGVSVVAVDMEDGSLLVNRIPPRNQYFEVDYRNGIVHLPERAWFLKPEGGFETKPVAGRALRFFYRADGDWAVAVQKAAASYEPVARPVRILPYRSCYVLPPVEVRQGGRTKYYLRVLFPIADQGKSVVLSYAYWDKRQGVRQVVHGVSAQISDQTVPGISADPLGELAGTWPAHPYVTVALPDEVDLARGVQVFDVKGTSLRVLTVWREGNRWRHQEVSTYLTRQEA